MSDRFKPIDIVLDKPRKLILDTRAMLFAEREINLRRAAKPAEWGSILFYMVDSYNRVFTSTGMLPLDLLTVVLWAGLRHEDPELKYDAISSFLDACPDGIPDLSGKVWTAFWQFAGRGLKKIEPENPAPADDAEKLN